ncbi:flavodoxin domain-containing protein [Actinoplanes sp. LDG1-06]|uniref:Flavodoxin domain-containing protein n=1 Tax=Paractinoplanes ovalisporus TaxID=2810368 RepID=A0ABS2ASH3_9ACTN|nr:flavodoxin domain-containing protein [Actinoplanes ovalisporus]MBM2622790.1 flavodoxin domain-containing protein [Actinoplanes ovalisporus]
MRALVLYESMFGNTATAAKAVAAGLADLFDVSVAEVGEAPSLVGVDLLVVGAPTHAFGLSRTATRKDAVRQGATGKAERGLREYLGAVEGLDGLAVAAYCTKMNRPFTGSAARKADRLLRQRGARPVCPPENFLVTGVSGPLVDGEVKRAEYWGARLEVPADATTA